MKQRVNSRMQVTLAKVQIKNIKMKNNTQIKIKRQIQVACLALS